MQSLKERKVIRSLLVAWRYLQLIFTWSLCIFYHVSLTFPSLSFPISRWFRVSDSGALYPIPSSQRIIPSQTILFIRSVDERDMGRWVRLISYLSLDISSLASRLAHYWWRISHFNSSYAVVVVLSTVRDACLRVEVDSQSSVGGIGNVFSLILSSSFSISTFWHAFRLLVGFGHTCVRVVVASVFCPDVY